MSIVTIVRGSSIVDDYAEKIQQFPCHYHTMAQIAPDGTGVLAVIAKAYLVT
jgi:hypothetical protein